MRSINKNTSNESYLHCTEIHIPCVDRLIYCNWLAYNIISRLSSCSWIYYWINFIWFVNSHAHLLVYPLVGPWVDFTFSFPFPLRGDISGYCSRSAGRPWFRLLTTCHRHFRKPADLDEDATDLDPGSTPKSPKTKTAPLTKQPKNRNQRKLQNAKGEIKWKMIISIDAIINVVCAR